MLFFCNVFLCEREGWAGQEGLRWENDLVKHASFYCVTVVVG